MAAVVKRVAEAQARIAHAIEALYCATRMQ